MKSLIVHIVSNYREILEKFNYVDVFKLLIERYEQYQDNSESTNNNDTTKYVSILNIIIYITFYIKIYLYIYYKIINLLNNY